MKQNQDKVPFSIQFFENGVWVNQQEFKGDSLDWVFIQTCIKKADSQLTTPYRLWLANGKLSLPIDFISGKGH